MRPAILTHAMIVSLVLFGLDRLWPFWLMHVLVIAAGIVVLGLASMAAVAAGKR